MGEGNDFMELLCWPAIGRLLIVSPFRMYPNRDYPCQDQPFQDVVAGPPAKVEGMQFESFQGHRRKTMSCLRGALHLSSGFCLCSASKTRGN
jgi:hypothetical protein